MLSNGIISIRLPRFEQPWHGATAEAPAPIQGLMGPDKVWRTGGRLLPTLDLQALGIVEDAQLRAEFSIRGVTPSPDPEPRPAPASIGVSTCTSSCGPLFAEHTISYDAGEYARKVRARVFDGLPFTLIEESGRLEGISWLHSLHNGLCPDIGYTNYRGQLNSYVFGRDDHLDYLASVHLGTIPSHNLENFREVWYAACSSKDIALDMVGVFRTAGGSWSRGARIGIYQTHDPDLLLRLDFEQGQRKWALFSVPKSARAPLTDIRTAMERLPHAFDPATADGENLTEAQSNSLSGQWKLENRPHYFVLRMRTSADESPLDVVRRQSLLWDEPLRESSLLWDPAMLTNRASETADVQSLLQHPGPALTAQAGSSFSWSDYFLLGRQALVGFLTGLPQASRSVLRYALQFSSQLVHDFMTLGGTSPTGLGAYNVGNQLKWLCYLYDICAPASSLALQEMEKLRANLAYLAYKLTDLNYFPFDRPEGSTNWNASRFKACAVFGLTFPHHPDSAFFTRHGIRHFKRELDECVFPGGAYIESTGYQQALMDPVFAFLVKQYGLFDPFRHPRYADMFRYFIRMQTPRCPRYLRRTLPAIGDVTWDQTQPFHSLKAAAPGFESVDPDLSAHMVWTANHGERPEAPSTDENLLERVLLPVPEEGQALQPELDSCAIDGFGAVLRADVGSADETYLAFKCGAGWGHYHSDEASFTLFGLGAPLALDAGKALYGTAGHRAMTSVRAHNTVCLNGQEQTGFRGRIERFSSSTTQDYVIGDASRAAGGLLRRHILFVKNSFFVLFDEIESHSIGHWAINVLADDLSREDDCWIMKGRFGVNLLVAFPGLSQPTVQIDETPIQGYGTQIRLVATVGGPLMSVLCPYRSGMQRPEVLWTGADRARIRTGGREACAYFQKGRLDIDSVEEAAGR